MSQRLPIGHGSPRAIVARPPLVLSRSLRVAWRTPSRVSSFVISPSFSPTVERFAYRTSQVERDTRSPSSRRRWNRSRGRDRHRKWTFSSALPPLSLSLSHSLSLSIVLSLVLGLARSRCSSIPSSSSDRHHRRVARGCVASSSGGLVSVEETRSRGLLSGGTLGSGWSLARPSWTATRVEDRSRGRSITRVSSCGGLGDRCARSIGRNAGT